MSDKVLSPEKRIVCFGDSNTYGYDPRGFFGGRYEEAVRWTGRLKQEGWDIINEGENGRQIPDTEWMYEHAHRLIARHEPFDLLCVMLGSNDLLMGRNYLAEDVTERMEAFLKDLQARGIRADILLISPPAMHPGDWVYEDRPLLESEVMHECYEALADRLGIRFTDASLWEPELSYDGVHLTEAGHAAFARGLGAELAKIFG